MPNPNINRRVTVASSEKYDASALALFNFVGDVPEVVKPFFDKIIKDFKASNVWSNTNFWAILCVPSLNAFNTLVEIKSLTIVSNFSDSSAIAPPYNIALRVGPTFAGYAFKSTAWLSTGFIPSVKMTANDSCEFLVTYSNEIAATSFNYGSLTGATASTAFTVKLNTSVLAGDAYSNTVGTGRVSVAATDGIAGVYLKNRRNNTYMSIVKNGIVVGSIILANGSLPNVETYLNTFNNSGTPSTRRNQSPIAAWGSFGSGLTAAQETYISNALITWQVSMQRLSGLETKQIVLASNSHGVYWFGALMRGIEHYSIVSGWKYANVSVSGQETSALITNYAAQIAPLYNAALTENWVYFNEVTNDLWFNGDLAGAKSRAITFINLCHATGFQVKISPIMCRKFTSNPGGRTETQFNNDINDWNVWALAGNSGADVVLPINPNTFVLKGAMSDAAYNAACAAIYSNATYFYDAATIGTHLVESEEFVWAQQFLSA